MNWKLKLLIMNLFSIACAIIMGGLVFTTGNAPNVLREQPIIYYFVLSTAIFSYLMTVIGMNLNKIKFANASNKENDKKT